MAKVDDVVLLYLEEAPVSFARVENIEPDAKKDWYHIKLLMLQVPLQVVTWILKDDYINGQSFNMNGKKMRLEKVTCPIEELPLSGLETMTKEDNNKEPDHKEKKDADIISFADLKKNHGPESG